MTGIDRVELEYLRAFLHREGALFGLVRSAVGWLLLDRAGCQELARLTGDAAPLPKADFLSRLAYRHDKMRGRAETATRRLAVARAARHGLGRLLRRLPAQCVYYNLGHANLTMKGLATIRSAGLRITVMIHDTIPLDHPHFARPDSVEPFRRKLAATSAHADRIIHLAQATRTTTETQLAAFGAVPQGIVAPLGIRHPQAAPSELPPAITQAAPYFVALGTIEPRKNQRLLLDVWQELPEPKPHLFILGNRGWASPDLLARLDNLPETGPIQVISGLSDGAVAALLAQATALLAPSFAEGFGLPPAEAASLGTAIVAADLAVTREILGNSAVYLNPSDIYSWVETIVRLANPSASRPGPLTHWIAPTWEAHFNTVLRLGW